LSALILVTFIVSVVLQKGFQPDLWCFVGSDCT